jgi:hypothetical protein
MLLARSRGVPFMQMRDGRWTPAVGEMHDAADCLVLVAKALGYRGAVSYNAACARHPDAVRARLKAL